jgi:hypothetical protein
MGEGRPKLMITVVRFDVVPIWDVDKDARRWASRRGLVVAEDTMLPLQVCHVLVLGEAFDVIDSIVHLGMSHLERDETLLEFLLTLTAHFSSPLQRPSILSSRCTEVHQVSGRN